MPNRKNIPTASFTARPPGSRREYTPAELRRMERESDEIEREVARRRRERNEELARERAERARIQAEREERGRQARTRNEVRARMRGEYAKGGKVKKMAKGGKVNCRRGDGICRQGRTRGKMR